MGSSIIGGGGVMSSTGMLYLPPNPQVTKEVKVGGRDPSGTGASDKKESRAFNQSLVIHLEVGG